MAAYSASTASNYTYLHNIFPQESFVESPKLIASYPLFVKDKRFELLTHTNYYYYCKKHNWKCRLIIFAIKHIYSYAY